MNKILPVFLVALAFLTFLAASVRAQVVINEILPNPAGDDTTAEWLEFYNSSGSLTDLAGYVIEDKNGKRIILSGIIDKWLVFYPNG